MKVILLPLLALFIIGGCSTNKFDKRHKDLQRQEAHNMIDESNEIKIKRGWGDDKIILEDL